MLSPRACWERLRDGVIPLLMTPFTADDQLDEEGLRREIQWLFENDHHGSLVGVLYGGTNAEFYALTDTEYERALRIIVDEIGGRAIVIAGAMGIGTKKTIETAKRIQDLGVDCLQIVNPYYITPTQEGALRHFEAIANAVDLGIELYNNPLTTHIYLQPKTVARLVDAVGEKLVAIKEYSPTNLDFLEMVTLVGHRIHVIDNNGPLFAHQIYAASLGCLTFMAQPHLAPVVYDIAQAVKRQDTAWLDALVRRSMPLNDFTRRVSQEQPDSHIALIKLGMELVGMPGGPSRMPLMPLRDEARIRREYAQILADLGLPVQQTATR